MESLFLLCLFLFMAGFIMGVSSLCDEEYVAAIIGFLIGLTSLFGAFFISVHIDENSWNCCGNEIHSEYCSECGEARPVECKDWTCCDHEYDSNIKFCPDCGKPKPITDITNNIVVKDNENVEINVHNDSVVVVKDKWTCCDKEVNSKFCPDCGKQNNNDITPNTETITKENLNNKGE